MFSLVIVGLMVERGCLETQTVQRFDNSRLSPRSSDAQPNYNHSVWSLSYAATDGVHGSCVQRCSERLRHPRKLHRQLQPGEPQLPSVFCNQNYKLKKSITGCARLIKSITVSLRFSFCFFCSVHQMCTRWTATHVKRTRWDIEVFYFSWKT